MAQQVRNRMTRDQILNLFLSRADRAKLIAEDKWQTYIDNTANSTSPFERIGNAVVGGAAGFATGGPAGAALGAVSGATQEKFNPLTTIQGGAALGIGSKQLAASGAEGGETNPLLQVIGGASKSENLGTTSKMLSVLGDPSKGPAALQAIADSEENKKRKDIDTQLKVLEMSSKFSSKDGLTKNQLLDAGKTYTVESLVSFLQTNDPKSLVVRSQDQKDFTPTSIISLTSSLISNGLMESDEAAKTAAQIAKSLKPDTKITFKNIKQEMVDSSVQEVLDYVNSTNPSLRKEAINNALTEVEKSPVLTKEQKEDVIKKIQETYSTKKKGIFGF